MAAKILQINYHLDGSPAEFEKALAPVADRIAAVPGLRWKVWLMNEATGQGGGLYLFTDEASLKTYVDGPIIAGLRSHPLVSDVDIREFDILDAPTATTRGPIAV